MDQLEKALGSGTLAEFADLVPTFKDALQSDGITDCVVLRHFSSPTMFAKNAHLIPRIAHPRACIAIDALTVNSTGSAGRQGARSHNGLPSR
jgi:hypothetical protein